MVDVVASNAKLRARARRVVELATDASEAEADAALVAAGGDAKVAILSLLTGVSIDAARRQLAEADGSIRRALGASA
jgi:N-acetylmuramic acid 6-phosphate etherase